MMLVSLTNQLGYNLSFPLSPLPGHLQAHLWIGKESSTNMSRSAATFSSVSRFPFGQRIVTVSAWSRLPSPKCSLKSLTEY